jgi:hypothetical protein
MRSIAFPPALDSHRPRKRVVFGIQVTSAIEKKERGVPQTRFAGYDDIK